MKNMNQTNDIGSIRIISEYQLIIITCCLMIIIFIGCLLNQRLGPLNILFLVILFPASFYLASLPLMKVGIDTIERVSDPKIWMPFAYIVYFITLPILTIVSNSTLSLFRYEIPQLAVSTILGVLSLLLGLYSIRSPGGSKKGMIKLDKYSPSIILIISVVVHLYWWFWRIKNGYFFTHAASYIPDANIESGIRDVFGMASLFIPFFILAFAYKNKIWNKIVCLCFFTTFSFVVGMLFLFSGAIRDFFWIFLLLTGLLFYMFQPRKINLFHLSAITMFVVIASIVLVYSMRQLSSNISKSGKQFTYILSNINNIVREGYQIGWIKETPTDRIFMIQDFFLRTVESITENGAYGYGTYTIETLPLVVPRLIWEKKGRILDTEQVIQQNVLRTFKYDGSLTPLTQYYAEGGLVGVVIGFFALGLITSGIHRICFCYNIGVSGLICWVVVLGSIIQWEGNIPVNLLLGLRNGIIFAIFSAISSFFFKKTLRLKSI